MQAYDEDLMRGNQFSDFMFHHLPPSFTSQIKMVRPPCCDKLNVKRGLWTAEEDAKILAHVSKHGTGNWTAVAKKAGLRRCGKSCRLRWTNYLRPDLKHDSFTPQEEELIVRLHATIGSRWSIIAQQLPGRTDNDVKNHWNTKLRKKLSQMGIDPITHKPFSQILADYGNINGGRLGTPRIGSLTRDLKNAFMSNTPSGDHIFLSTTHHDDEGNNSPSLNLLTQLKAIELVAEASSSSSSASASASTRARHGKGTPSDFLGEVVEAVPPSALSPPPPPSFSWHEFLLEDAFLPPSSDLHEQEDMPPDLSSNADGKDQGNNNPVEETVDTVGLHSNGGSCEASSSSTSSSGSSFLEAMLDRENDMFLEFPGLLEEPFYY